MSKTSKQDVYETIEGCREACAASVAFPKTKKSGSPAEWKETLVSAIDDAQTLIECMQEALDAVDNFLGEEKG